MLLWQSVDGGVAARIDVEKKVTSFIITRIVK